VEIKFLLHGRHLPFDVYEVRDLLYTGIKLVTAFGYATKPMIDALP
jgi:hypothetical protein